MACTIRDELLHRTEKNGCSRLLKQLGVTIYTIAKAKKERLYTHEATYNIPSTYRLLDEKIWSNALLDVSKD